MYRNTVNQKVCEQSKIAKRKLNEMDNSIDEVLDYAGEKYGFLYFYCNTKSDERIIVSVNKYNVDNSAFYYYSRLTDNEKWNRLNNNISQNLTSQY